MKKMFKSKILIIIMIVLCFLSFGGSLFAEEQKEVELPILKIGVLGTMSGAAASWGLTIKYSAEAIAEIYNNEGGIEIDGKKYIIKIVAVDDKMDPRIAKTGMEFLVYKEKIKYIMGTCVDDTTASSQPVLEAAGAINVTYAFAKDLFMAPHYNTILGMVTPYNSAPVIYKYMMENRGVKTVAFIARNDADALYERGEGIVAAKELGLKILSWTDTYEPGTVDFFPVMTKVISSNPDHIVLSGVSPGDAPQLLKAARELGYKGQISCETGQDIKILNEIAGKYAENFVFVGGASTPEIRSAYMEKFMENYIKIAGEWNDEAGTKCYALQMVLYTIQEAGATALDDIEVFKKAIPRVVVRNPFLKEEKTLRYIGGKTMGHLRQIGVPLVINQAKNGKFETLLFLTEY
jgi:branched-chain amino acid transport system substrate-binding protein